jgi:hypothetical protein
VSGFSRRLVVTLSLVVAGFAFCAAGARADGDPASDFLVVSNVFLPTSAAPPASAAALIAQVKSVYEAGNRIKVAVIATRSDLGSIPSLFGKPGDYAGFLGQELIGIYVGPLLIVMPAGYGIYDGGRQTEPESALLSRLPPPNTRSPEELTRLAAEAVRQLNRAGALRSPDILRPYASTLAATTTGGKLKLSYYVADDSGRAAVTFEIVRAGRVLLTSRVPLAAVNGQRTLRRTIALPPGLSLAKARVCTTATDPAANRGPRLCMAIKGTS